MKDDSIGFNVANLETASQTAEANHKNLVDYAHTISEKLRLINGYWEGELREAAQVDFNKASSAMNNILNNSRTIEKIISDKAAGFNDIRYRA